MKKQQLGASLIEVLIAVTLLGFGLLGLAGVQSRTNALNDSAYYRSIAADLGNDLAERIRAVRTPFMVNASADPQPPKPPDFSKCTILGTTVSCTAQDTDRATHGPQALTEMTTWAATLQRQLPGASYTLTQTTSSSSAYFRYTLIIRWLDDRVSGDNSTYRVVIE